jgi:hypothetical protein
MYYPMLTRFATYGVPLPDELLAYSHAVEAVPAVRALAPLAQRAPRMVVYDDYVRSLGGDPDALL